MSDDKKPEIKTASPAPAQEAPKGLGARIRKQGVNESHGIIKPAAADPQPAGLYRVTHGNLLLGHEDGGPVYAHPGAEVQLTGEEAATLVRDGHVKLIARAA
jgi:hypothetical protein